MRCYFDAIIPHLLIGILMGTILLMEPRMPMPRRKLVLAMFSVVLTLALVYLAVWNVSAVLTAALTTGMVAVVTLPAKPLFG